MLALGQLIVQIASGFAIVWGALKLNENSRDIKEVKHATNSMKDELVAATAKGSLAEGVAQGRAEVTAERKASP